MKQMRKNVLSILLSFLAMAFYLIPLNTGVALGANDEGKVAQVSTKIKHKPISYFVAEKRIRLDAEVKDKAGVELVRCYFKGKAEADYVFVTMNQGDIGEYSGILPAPSQNAEMIEYLFLVVNKSNQVVKTQTFNVKRNPDVSKIPSWQNLPLEGTIKIGIELGEAPATLEGFSDSITMDIVESSLRFGFVAALYSSVQMAAAGGVSGGAAAAGSGTAAAATAGGTVTATSGLSTAAIAGLAIGGAVLVGGGAAAAVGLGGSGSTSTDYSKYSGTWSASFTTSSYYGYGGCSTPNRSYTLTVSSTGAATMGTDGNCPSVCSGSFAGNVMTLTCNNTYDPAIGGCCMQDTYSITFSDQNHGTGTHRRSRVTCPTNTNWYCLWNTTWTK